MSFSSSLQSNVFLLVEIFSFLVHFRVSNNRTAPKKQKIIFHMTCIKGQFDVVELSQGFKSIKLNAQHVNGMTQNIKLNDHHMNGMTQSIKLNDQHVNEMTQSIKLNA